MKLATSLDGAVAMAGGESQWITGADSRADVQRMRAESGAILSGLGTVLADDPSFTVREPSIKTDGLQPLRVILDSELRLPLSSRMLCLPGDTLIFCSVDQNRSALEDQGAEVVKIGANLAVDFRPRATCAVCLIQENGSWWGHIGDSRIYHMRDGKLVTRSRDHSHVEVLIQEGAITEQEALDHPMRNFVECCIGGDSPVPDMSITRKMPLIPGDVLLACTDGLWSGIPDDEMADMATRPVNGLAENLKALSVKALTLNAPYSDNTTGTALKWLGE